MCLQFPFKTLNFHNRAPTQELVCGFWVFVFFCFFKTVWLTCGSAAWSGSGPSHFLAIGVHAPALTDTVVALHRRVLSIVVTCRDVLAHHWAWLEEISTGRRGCQGSFSMLLTCSLLTHWNIHTGIKYSTSCFKEISNGKLLSKHNKDWNVSRCVRFKICRRFEIITLPDSLFQTFCGIPHTSHNTTISLTQSAIIIHTWSHTSYSLQFTQASSICGQSSTKLRRNTVYVRDLIKSSDFSTAAQRHTKMYRKKKRLFREES